MAKRVTERALTRIRNELVNFGKQEIPVEKKVAVDDKKKLMLAKKFGAKPKIQAKELELAVVSAQDPVPEPIPEPMPARIHQEERMTFLIAADDDITKLRAMIIGPDDTPYAGIFLYFEISITHDYPITPPIFKYATPDSPDCRMHPNLYAEGKVCLSILNTWASNQWCASATFDSILHEIIMILGPDPIINEPGYENAKPYDRAVYRFMARFRALRAGVVAFMKRKDTPPEFMKAAREYIESHKQVYAKSIDMLIKDAAEIGLYNPDGTKTPAKHVDLHTLHVHTQMSRDQIRNLASKVRETVGL
jgi:ubiquitin-protein ligase